MITKRDTKIKKISFVAIAVSFLFFFNANVHVIDFLPDIIGYIVLSVALIKLADLNEDIYQARRFFGYMILVEVGKAVSLLWVFGLSRNNEKETGILLIAFAFAVIDALILTTAMNRLFSGIISLGFVHKNDAVLGSRKPNGRSYTEKMRAFTLFFVLFKCVMAVLPEFSNLASYEYDESSGFVDIYEYIGLMRGMSLIITTVVGIVWVIKSVKYFSRLQNDIEFRESLSSAYRDNVLPKSGVFIKRNFSLSFGFFVAASIFMFDLRLNDININSSLDCINILPDFLGAALFISGIVICYKRLTLNKGLVWIGGIVYFLTSVGANVAEFMFYFKGYDLSSIYRKEEVYNSYITMSAATIAQTVGFLIMVAVLLYCMSDIIKNHTGFVYGNDVARDRERLESYHKTSRKKLWFVAVAALLVAVSDIFYVCFASRFVYAGFIGTVATLIFLISVIRTTNELKDEIETKYMLD